MRHLLAAGIAGVALAALCGCNKPSAGGQASAAAGPPAESGSIAPTQAPHRKPGLWRQVMVIDGAAAGPGMQLCVDQASEARMSMFARHGGQCAAPQFTRNLDGSINFSDSCDLGAKGKVLTNGVIRGDLDSGYTERIDARYSGSPVASVNGDHQMTVKATRIGPCAPGQKGGDLILPGGMKRNMLEDAPPSS